MTGSSGIRRCFFTIGPLPSCPSSGVDNSSASRSTTCGYVTPTSCTNLAANLAQSLVSTPRNAPYRRSLRGLLEDPSESLPCSAQWPLPTLVGLPSRRWLTVQLHWKSATKKRNRGLSGIRCKRRLSS